MAQLSIADSVTKIPYVGEKQANLLARLAIKTVEDLLCFAPRDVVDLRAPAKIADAKKRFREKLPVFAKVEKTSIYRTPRKGVLIVQAELSDETGKIEAIWFNQPYLKKSLKVGEKYLFYGQIDYNFATKTQAISSPAIYPEAGMLTVYAQTERLSSRQISRFVKLAMDKGYKLDEFLPKKTLDRFKLLEMARATRFLHFPSSTEEFLSARHRFNFNNLLVFILANLSQQKNIKKFASFKIKPDLNYLKDVISSLPFELTADQKKVLLEITNNLKGEHPMNRILQGDVGSGKTIVALLASLLIIKSGCKAVWMAPTEILATQHYNTVLRLTKKLGIKTGLVTSSSLGRSRSKNYELRITDESKIHNSSFIIHNSDLFIGTHALLYNKLPKNIALVAVDEQHRFGVEQREALQTKNKGRMPHFLSLSATPIPRTLAHILFGNLDISTIRTMPHGRKTVKTYLVPKEKRQDSYKFIKSLLSRGQQAFVICPLIKKDEQPEFFSSETLFDQQIDERRTVEEEIKILKKTVLNESKMASLHGKMKSEEKNKVMTEMKNGELDVLVSTSVVEVGVDIERATVMIIENAEQFGLSQLHQFRGRIGRNNLQSYCLLFSNNLDSEKTRSRLKAFIQNTDGFKLAELDLKQRGPGAVLGLNQSGFKNFNPLWFENTQL
ncbi:MAG: ATP-dependent DNA helicase RecG, partial [Candidatus Berkelbacteria bacterium]|nr:ATP-dependent DNA helicase RecG [Candidatus Berkelbacteria bacterium]